jgi:Tfp pilus assembly protein PilV
MRRLRQIAAPAGFSLIEAMIAMFFVAFMATEMGMVMTFSSRNSNLSQRISRANALADEAIEKSRNTAYPSLQLPSSVLLESCTTSGQIVTCTSTPDNGRFTRVRTITPRDTSFPPGITVLDISQKADIEVRVTFTDLQGNPQEIRVGSIISRR